MGIDTSVEAVIGFPLKVSDIADEIDIPSCDHAERVGAAFCPICGKKVATNKGLALRDEKRTPIDWRHIGDTVKIRGVGLISRENSADDKPAPDDLYLCGIRLAMADVIRETSAAEVSIAEMNQALAKVSHAHAAIPGAPLPALHLLPYASY